MQNKIAHDIIYYTAQHYARKLHGEVARDARDDRLAYYHGGESDNYSAAAHVYIGKALILHKQRARERDERV